MATSFNTDPSAPAGTQLSIVPIWRVIIFLLVMIGFGSIAITGEIHPAVLVMFMAGWVLGLMYPELPTWWPQWLGRGMMWGALVGIGWYAVHLKFESLIYLLLFLGLYKCLTLRTTHDYLHALLMAFFMLLTSSIITTSILFVVLLLVFIILAILALVCFTMAREEERSRPASPRKGRGRGGRLEDASAGSVFKMFRVLLYSSILLGGMVLVGAYLLFLMMPHYSSHTLNGPWRKETRKKTKSGYEDKVSFKDSINHIEQDNTLVMKVHPYAQGQPDTTLPRGIYMRGRSLSHYDEVEWAPEDDERIYQSANWSMVNLPIPSVLPSQPVDVKIRQNIHLTNRLFSLTYPKIFYFDKSRPQDLLVEWRSRSVSLKVWPNWNQGPQLQDLDYMVSCSFVTEASSFLRSWALANSGHGQPPELDKSLTMSQYDRNLYTQLPSTPMTGRLMTLSRGVANALSVPGKTVQLLDWFARDFEYSLTPETPEGMHPIESFLTWSNKGHCEYFATSMVLLLRAQGVPARMVSGFFTTEWDGGANCFLVRQSDAHSWVEIWLDGAGWLMLDPTPASSRGRASYSNYVPPFWESLNNRLKIFWQRYVLDYSYVHQNKLLSNIVESQALEEPMMQLQLWMQRVKAHQWHLWSIKSQGWTRQQAVMLGKIVGLALLGAVLLVLLFWGWRRQNFQRKLHSPMLFVNELIARLEKKGWPRRPGQTLAEYLASVADDPNAPMDLTWILEIYHQCRYGSASLSREERLRISETLRQLR